MLRVLDQVAGYTRVDITPNDVQTVGYINQNSRRNGICFIYIYIYVLKKENWAKRSVFARLSTCRFKARCETMRKKKKKKLSNCYANAVERRDHKIYLESWTSLARSSLSLRGYCRVCFHVEYAKRVFTRGKSGIISTWDVPRSLIFTKFILARLVLKKKNLAKTNRGWSIREAINLRD